jgi:hypothetical protein
MPLRPHRRSFVGTTVLASSAAIGLLVAFGTTAFAIRRNAGDNVLPAWIARTVFALVAVGLLAASLIAALVTIGGVAVVHRDSCEERGVPYRPVRPRERVAGPMRLALRRLINPRARPRPGDLVEVRSLPEILATLDERGCLDGLPFMPEMVAYCGHRFVVLRRVEKLWEYAHSSGMRRIRHALLLKTLRCDGRSHGGCQTSCHLIWKEDWVKWPGKDSPRDPRGPGSPDLGAHTQFTTPQGTRYVCQATQIREASEQLRFNSLGHYWRDLVAGNVRLGAILVEFGVRFFNGAQSRLGRPRWPVLQPVDSDTSPHQELQLQPGQLVRVKSKHEIELTLNRDLRNRGLSFGGDMLIDCGGSYRVAASINRVVHEGTGELLSLKNPSILLEGVHAMGRPLLIPQNEYFFWREIWLEPKDSSD